MTPGFSIVALLLVPFAAGLAAIFLRRSPRGADAVLTTATAGCLAASLALLAATAGGQVHALHVGGWPGGPGIVLVADTLAALMLCVCNFVALCTAVHGWRALPTRYRLGRAHAFTAFMIFGVNGAFLAGDLFNLYVWFEVLLLSSFALMGLVPGSQGRSAALRYVVLNLIASLLFLTASGLIYAKTGTLNFADLTLRLRASPDGAQIATSAVLLFGAFAIKAAVFPFSIWLPASYPRPPIAISALFAALLTKVGVYALLRCFGMVFPAADTGLLPWFGVFAGLTMLCGVLGAASRGRIRDILSFHIISQIGYMIVGAALLGQAALAAAIFYVVHHIVVKTNLFLIAGQVEGMGGRGDDLDRLGGVAKRAPWLAVLFLIPALSLAGIPPLSGFWAKFALIRASLDDGAVILAVVALVTGILTLFSMAKIWAGAFWKEAPANPPAFRFHASSVAPIVAMALVTVGLGLHAQPLFDRAETAALQLAEPAAYIRAVLGENPASAP
jgi:multicomponent Na+:H+ antiporter subunit D